MALVQEIRDGLQEEDGEGDLSARALEQAIFACVIGEKLEEKGLTGEKLNNASKPEPITKAKVPAKSKVSSPKKAEKSSETKRKRSLNDEENCDVRESHRPTKIHAREKT